MNDISPKVAYSCVVDRDPEYFFQAQIFISSLIELAHVQPSNIFIHHIGMPDSIIGKFYRMVGVNLICLDSYSEENHVLNKLIQLNTPELSSFDKIVLCDCSIAITEAVQPKNFPNGIYAKEVDLPNPPTWMLRRLLYCSGIEAATEERTTSFRSLSDKFILNSGCSPENEFEFTTLTNNCNGGIYIIDRDIWAKISAEWPRWANWLLGNSNLLGDWASYAAQISLALATWSAGISVNSLPLSWNFPLHLPLLVDDENLPEPKVLNFHSAFTIDGLLNQLGIPRVDKVVNKINDANEKFISKLTGQDPDMGLLLCQRRQRWLEWNNSIMQRPLPLPDFMECEKPLISIETGGFCNYSCNYCPVSVSTARRGLLSVQIFQSLVDELISYDGAFQLRFHFYNEPLLDKRLPVLIAYAKKRLPNTYMRLVSNGDLLDFETASELFTSGLDHIAVTCHKEEVFQRLSELASNQPGWNLQLRQAYSRTDWSDRRGIIDLESHGYTRYVPPGINRWGCSLLPVIIDYMGKVHMCCEDFEGELILGDVTTEGLASIIRRNQGRIKRAYCGFFDSTCNHCAGLE